MRNREETKDHLITGLKKLPRILADSGKVPISQAGACGNAGAKDRAWGNGIRAIEGLEKAQGIIEAIGDGIRIIDADFRIIYENGPHRELLGTHIGEYCFSAYRQRNSECEMCPLAVTLADGIVHRAERPLTTATETRYLGITASPVKDATGKIVAALVVVRDITDRKLMQAEKEKLIEELREALVNIRTLKGLIPICAWCRNVRNDRGYWDKLENYLRDNSEANFSHGICPECIKKVDPKLVYPDRSNVTHEKFVSDRETT